jgi:hypothetical protein
MVTDPLWVNAGKAGTAVGTATIAESTDLFTITGHGLADGDTVSVDTLTGGAVGVLVADAVYFVRDSLTNTFALSLTPHGAPVLFSVDGGATVYRWQPQYHAQELRRSTAAWLWAGVTSEFGARPGVRAHATDPISVASTTWTVHDLTAVVAGAGSGPYIVAVSEQSASLDPADGSNPRIDGLDLLIEDDDEDASGDRQATVVYVPGSPASSPTAPAVTTNALRLGTILVPAAGSPVPSVATLGSMSAAAGGIPPLRVGETKPTAGVREGMYLDQDDALQRRGASAWVPVASPSSPTTVVITASGAFTKATFPWAHRYRAHLKAAGGSGGAVEATGVGEHAEGGGGGEGEYAQISGNVADLPTSVTVTIGAGGAAATAGANNGNAGGTTTWAGASTVTVVGGDGGNAGTAETTSVLSGGGNGGDGGTGTADLRIPGCDGGNGRVIGGSMTKTGSGGGTTLSSVASSRTVSSTGEAGHAYGGGSAGASNGESQAARASLAAAAGAVIVELY